MRISDWSSDVCSSDLRKYRQHNGVRSHDDANAGVVCRIRARHGARKNPGWPALGACPGTQWRPSTQALPSTAGRSEEHTSELQSLMRISYAVFCLKKKKKQTKTRHTLTSLPTRTYDSVDTCIITC